MAQGLRFTMRAAGVRRIDRRRCGRYFMPMPQNFFPRFAPWILLAFLAITPVLFLGTRGALRNVNNDVRAWLPEAFEETRQYQWFLSHFGTEEMVVLSWPGARLDDSRLARLARELSRYAAVEEHHRGDASVRPMPWFREIHTGASLLEELTGPPLHLSRAEARRRLRGAVIGPDGQSSALIAVLSPSGAENRHEVVALLQRKAAEVGVPSGQVRMGGPTIDSVALDIESERARYFLSVIAVLVALALAWRALRQLRLALIVFATALLSTAISVAVMHFTGGVLDLIMIMMPTLIYVMAISGSVHLVNYYRDVVVEHGLKDAPLRALKIGRLPAVLSAVTTAVGLGSLGISQVLPVKMFGIYSAVGVVCTLPCLLLFLPAALEYWPMRLRSTDGMPVPGPDASGALAHWTHRSVEMVVRFRKRVLFASVALMVLMGIGLARLETSVRLLDLFSPDARIVQDYIWLERHLGPLVPIEVVLQFEPESGTRLVERLDLVRTVHQRLEAHPHVGGMLSAATFAPDMPATGGLGNLFQRRVVEERLRENRQRLVEANYLRDTEDGQLWRVSARVQALAPIDYGEFIHEMRQEVGPLIAEWSERYDDPVAATFTGMVPLVYQAQRTLLDDLKSSFMTAFALISLVMMGLLRSIRAGLLAMLPNVFPAVIAFGFLGWLGRPIGIGPVMTASLALGIAVDDTIHVLNWFRRGIREGLTGREALFASFRHCAGAMLQTSIITGVGVLAFTFSSFLPTSHFAWLLFALLFLAVLGDLVLLPAMLIGRWGRFFAGQRGRRDAALA